MRRKNNIQFFRDGMPPEMNILVIPVDKVENIQHLFDIVVADGTQGKKTDNYWILSTSTQFNRDGTAVVEYYNNLMLNSKTQGYGYVQVQITQ